MRHLAYTVRYSVVPINSSLLTMTLYSSVITTLIYNDTVCSTIHDVITEFDCACKYSASVSFGSSGEEGVVYVFSCLFFAHVYTSVGLLLTIGYFGLHILTFSAVAVYKNLPHCCCNWHLHSIQTVSSCEARSEVSMSYYGIELTEIRGMFRASCAWSFRFVMAFSVES
jgi:hypothetical protein